MHTRRTHKRRHRASRGVRGRRVRTTCQCWQPSGSDALMLSASAESPPTSELIEWPLRSGGEFRQKQYCHGDWRVVKVLGGKECPTVSAQTMSPLEAGGGGR